MLRIYTFNMHIHISSYIYIPTTVGSKHTIVLCMSEIYLLVQPTRHTHTIVYGHLSANFSYPHLHRTTKTSLSHKAC